MAGLASEINYPPTLRVEPLAHPLIAGFVAADLGLPLLTVALTQLQAELTLPSDILCYFGAVVAVALIGGLTRPWSPPWQASCDSNH